MQGQHGHLGSSVATVRCGLVDTFNSSLREIKVEAARALLRIAGPQIAHLVDLLRNGDPPDAMASRGCLRDRRFDPGDLIAGADSDLRRWMSYIVGYGKDNFAQADVEAICKADPEVYFAASVLWQILSSWVTDLKEY